MTTSATPLELLESSEYRVEGPLKVTGAARYVADMVRPGMLWAAFAKSPLPHARIRRIDTGRARAMPGVHSVLTGAEIGRPHFGRRLLDRPVLAFDRVRFIGERVAAVAAESREAAEAAAAAIEVEYEELPPVLSTDEALADDAPILHEHPERYEYLGGERPPVPHPNVQGYLLKSKGVDDLESIFAAADHVFEHTFHTPRQHHGYIEPHAALVWIDEAGTVHVASTNKAPFLLRRQLSRAFDVEEELIDVDSGFIGGDFGGKGFSLDEFVCYFLARDTGRPVKAVMSYVDELEGANPRHAAAITLRTGLGGDGRFMVHTARVDFDGGAYAGSKPLPHLVLAGGLATLAAYQVPNTRLELRTVYTNTVPAGHMRAPGEVQALFAGESHVDIIARELGRDPLDFRQLNALRPGDLGPAGERHREPRGAELLEALRRETGWGRPLPEDRGRGVAIGLRHVGAGKVTLRLGIAPDGRVVVRTGMPDQGGGAYTMLQRVIAIGLSVKPERIGVVRESTATAPLDPGVGGSRVTHIASRAALDAAIELKALIEERASEVIGESVEQLRLEDDWLVSEDGANRLWLTDAARVIGGEGLSLSVERTYAAEAHGADHPGDYNFGAYAVEVEVDRETGAVRIVNAVLAADVGKVINPVAHQGQLEGGFVFGLGAASMEELLVEGGKVETLNLGEYKLPTSMDIPPLRTLLLPTEVGPGAFGAKMAGELSNATVAPAVANAVADAVGVRLTELPVTSERVYAALNGWPRPGER